MIITGAPISSSVVVILLLSGAVSLTSLISRPTASSSLRNCPCAMCMAADDASPFFGAEAGEYFSISVAESVTAGIALDMR